MAPISRRRLPGWLWLVLLAGLAVPWSGRSASPAPSGTPSGFADTLTTFSQSGQFVVTGPRSKRPGTMELLDPENPVRELTPQTVAVSCERVKAAVLEVLEIPDAWRTGGGGMGKILVSIDATVRTNRSVAVQASPFERGWQFRLALPTRIDETRLVRALTQALLLELANRPGNQRLGEPPLWLVEGLTQAVLAESPEGVILQPQTRAMTVIRVDETAGRLRDRLRRRAPLSFYQLSQPDLDAMDERAWDHYGACAHLCVRELLRVPEGRDRLLRWLRSLQGFWNWQTGFTDAYRPVFHSLLDVEKWWALTLANAVGRDATSATWPAAFALRKLDEALHPVGILPGTGARPGRLQLEEVLNRWEFDRQVPLLRQLLQQMHAIRISSPPEVAALVFRHIDIIEEYLVVRGRQGPYTSMRGQVPPSVKIATRTAVSRLRELQSERDRLAAAAAEPAPGNPPAGT